MFQNVARNQIRTLIFLQLILIFYGCSNLKPIYTEPKVDLPRYMGDWYVIANIPTFIEKNAFNAIENYKLNPDGTIATTFTFNEGALDGPAKKYQPTGYVYDKESNAYWGMQFLWPFKGEFRIVYVDPNYQFTIIGRTKRDYLWIMARTSKIDNLELEKMINIAKEQGYDASKIRMIPHK